MTLKVNNYCSKNYNRTVVGEYVKGALFFTASIAPTVLASGIWGDGSGAPRPGYETQYGLVTSIGTASFMWSIVDGIGTTLRYSDQSRKIGIELSVFTEQEKFAIEKRSVFIGMSANAVIASLGKPSKINRTVGSWGTHEQWVYTGGYVYIENGHVSSWQD